MSYIKQQLSNTVIHMKEKDRKKVGKYIVIHFYAQTLHK